MPAYPQVHAQVDARFANFILLSAYFCYPPPTPAAFVYERGKISQFFTGAAVPDD